MATLKKSKLFKTLALMLAAIFTLICFAACGKGEENADTTEAPTEKQTEAPVSDGVIRNPLTGEPGYDEAQLKARPVFVSVENHPEARPQWGITESDMVFEMVAEGGITRTLQVFANPDRLPDKIGPTRSARYYFVDLVDGYDAYFVHFGCNTYAEANIAEYGTADIDGYIHGGYFHRDESRNVAFEHTAYTTKDDVKEAIADLGYRTEIKDAYAQPYKFNAEPVALGGGECTEFTVDFSSSFVYTFTYDAENKVYLSHLNGEAFCGSNGVQQSFTNLLVLYTTVSTLDASNKTVRLGLDEGSGKYISNGTQMDITWKKGNHGDMLKFYDANGEEIALNVGRSYVGIVGK